MSLMPILRAGLAVVAGSAAVASVIDLVAGYPAYAVLTGAVALANGGLYWLTGRVGR